MLPLSIGISGLKAFDRYLIEDLSIQIFGRAFPFVLALWVWMCILIGSSETEDILLKRKAYICKLGS